MEHNSSKIPRMALPYILPFPTKVWNLIITHHEDYSDSFLYSKWGFASFIDLYDIIHHAFLHLSLSSFFGRCFRDKLARNDTKFMFWNDDRKGDRELPWWGITVRSFGVLCTTRRHFARSPAEDDLNLHTRKQNPSRSVPDRLHEKARGICTFKLQSPRNLGRSGASRESSHDPFHGWKAGTKSFCWRRVLFDQDPERSWRSSTERLHREGNPNAGTERREKP
jgi:hypothetical protein